MARKSDKRFTPGQKLKIVKEGSLPNVRAADNLLFPYVILMDVPTFGEARKYSLFALYHP